ncbi:MAG TPA: hypothetical protein VEL73_07015 [Mycobacteriales bacterium]|nr:hypothetical protein [Mycobacteriales bacterium]
MPSRAGVRVAAPAAAVGAVAAVAGAVLLGGCEASQAPPPAPSLSSSPAATVRGHERRAAGRDEVQDAYLRFWSVSWRLDERPPPAWQPVLSSVAVDPVLTRLLLTAERHRQHGIVRYGTVAARVGSVTVQGRRAVVTDCQDASRAGQADRRTGARRIVGVARAPVVAVLLRGADGRWRVSDVDYKGDQC